MITLRVKVIVWGWVLSFMMVTAAPATMEAGIDSGSWVQFFSGLILIMAFGRFSYLIHKHSKECEKYADKLDTTLIRFIKRF